MNVLLFLAFVCGLAIGLALHGTWWPLMVLGVAMVVAVVALLWRIPEPT